jgi:hypothetical protein
MGALFAEVLGDKSIAPVSLAPLPGVDAFRTKVSIPRDLDPGHGRRCFSVVELGTGELASPAAYALRRVCNDYSLSLIDDDQGHFLASFSPQGGNSNNSNSTDQEEFTPRKRMIHINEIQNLFQNLVAFVLMTHFPPPLK